MRLFLFLSCIGAALATQERTTRIVGGRPTTIEEHPFMSNMMHSYWGTWFAQSCGGSLITRIAVLSAAQCFNRQPVERWRVQLGSTNAASGGTDYAISHFIIHSHFNPRLLTSDIAIVRLATAATLSNSVKLARIAGPNYALPDGLRVYKLGWGHTSFGGSSSEVLRYVDVNIINHSLCTVRYSLLKTQPGFQSIPDVTPDMICSGILDVGGQDACQGDAGGPVVHQNDVVVGIISWRHRCADPFYPGVSVHVPSYTQWISANAVN